MKRWFYFLICAVLGLTLLAGGLLVPAHLRAMDAVVIQHAGQSSATLLDECQKLTAEEHLGAAQMLLQAAQIENLSGWEKTGSTWTNLDRQNPTARFWGDDAGVINLFGDNFQPADQNAPFADFVIRRENRVAALARLDISQNPAARELARTRELAKTEIFPPPQSASGQAFDTAVAICGLLLDSGHLTSSLNNELLNLAFEANRGGGSRPLEQALLDFTSLGARFNWDQLTAFVAKIPDVATLHSLADEARVAGAKLPVLFAAVQLSGKPAAVAAYLEKFKQTGLADLGAGLRYGGGGIDELAQSQRRFHDSNLERRVTTVNPLGAIFYHAAEFSVRHPLPTLAAKWFLYLLAGFLLAAAMHFALPPLEPELRVRGFHLLREFLFSLGFLLVVLLLSEPFLAQENQQGRLALRLFPSTVGGAVPAGIPGFPQTQTVMNPIILLTLLVFFVFQALIYLSCLVKLAEIRRQNLPPRIKLKLLENEDHLFDAGLYLGFVGTILSLIIASLGLVKFSLMAAYSSTCFGIIFVVVFKIFHLRPARRKLLLEAEEASGNPESRIQNPTSVSAS